MGKCEDCPEIVDCWQHHETNASPCWGIDRLETLYDVAKILHARLRDEYVLWDSAYRLGKASLDYPMFKAFEDALVALGPLSPVTGEDDVEDGRVTADGRLVAR